MPRGRGSPPSPPESPTAAPSGSSSKGQPDAAGTFLVEASLQEERISHRHEETGRAVAFDLAADQVTGPDGVLDHPRSSFAGLTSESPWSPAQIGYFRGYATWHYLVEPYLFGWPGVVAREVEPWTDGDEKWRVLRVDFPPEIHTHNATQLYYYYDEAGLLRRMDYAPDVNGGTPVAHYIREHQVVDGIPVPSERHVHLRDDDRTPDLSWLPITVDLADVELR